MNDFTNLCRSLSNLTRLQLIDLLKEEDFTANELFKKLKSTVVNTRQTIYYALEDLVNQQTLEKYYDSDQKKLKYRLEVSSILLSLKDFSFALNKGSKTLEKDKI